MKYRFKEGRIVHYAGQPFKIVELAKTPKGNPAYRLVSLYLEHLDRAYKFVMAEVRLDEGGYRECDRSGFPKGPWVE